MEKILSQSTGGRGGRIRYSSKGDLISSQVQLGYTTDTVWSQVILEDTHFKVRPEGQAGGSHGNRQV